MSGVYLHVCVLMSMGTYAHESKKRTLPYIKNTPTSEVREGISDSRVILDMSFHGPHIHSFSNSSDLW